MTRRDPLPALIMLGILGCGLLATLNPTEALDVEDLGRQAGRFVHVSLHVLSSNAQDGWARGQAAPAGADEHGPPTVLEWTWFRAPPNPPLPGDQLDGRAKVERNAHGLALVLDGTGAAVVTPGPHPVPVRWDDLAARPEAYEGRHLVLRGVVETDTLVGPEGHRCTLARAIPSTEAEQHVVRLVRDPLAVGWRCAWEGAA